MWQLLTKNTGRVGEPRESAMNLTNDNERNRHEATDPTFGGPPVVEARAREAIAPLIGLSPESIAYSERNAESLAMALSTFFEGVAHTDAALADVAEENRERAVETEEQALEAFTSFLDDVSEVEEGYRELRQRAVESEESQRMETHLSTGSSWEDYFDAIIHEVETARRRVEYFVEYDREHGVELLESGEPEEIIDRTGPIAADMVRSVCLMVLTVVDSAVASHRAINEVRGAGTVVT